MVIFVKQSMNYNDIISVLFIIHYIIVVDHMLHYILNFILLLIYNLLKGTNSKIKLVRPRLWQLEVLVREADGGGGNTIHGLLSSDLHFP